MIILMTTDKFSPLLSMNHFLQEYKSVFTHNPLPSPQTKYLPQCWKNKGNRYFFIFPINSFVIFPSSDLLYMKMAVFPTLCQVLVPVNLSTDL